MKNKKQTVLKSDMMQNRFSALRMFVIIILVFALAMASLLLFGSSGRAGSEADSFSEKVFVLPDGWTITDSSGNSKTIQLPYTVEYGTDGIYTLSGVLPDSDELIGSPVFCFYSNYTDFNIKIDGETLLVYPEGENTSGATGNTYHFLRLPFDYEGKTIEIDLSCQLGDKITYLLRAPLVGSKATILNKAIMQSLPSILLAGFMILLAAALAVFYLLLRRMLKLSNATAYTALFAIIFAVYVFCETYFAQLIMPNGYALFSMTLMLLAMLPIPLFGIFAENVSTRFKRVPVSLMILCSINFVGQVVLHYAGVSSLRVMLPATHATIIVSIFVMIVCLLLSDKKEMPEARKKLLTALPMIVGGLLDIFLLMINKPSFNNSFWFTMGVTMFVVIQFISFTRGFFVMYRASLEASVLHDMAYRDMLTGSGNRNAYECKIKELSERETHENLGCIIVDINDLKLINDNYGHASGDVAIVETSSLIKECLPVGTSCFRTGGDEFVSVLDNIGDVDIDALAQRLTEEAERRGSIKSIPLSIAVGSGCFEQSDGNVLEFIRRVDSDMYNKKRAAKSSASYYFYRE